MTSSRKPKPHFTRAHLFAHTPLHTRTLTHTHTDTHWHSDANSLCFTQAQTFVGPPRGRGQGGEGPLSLARMVSCTLLHPVAVQCWQRLQMWVPHAPHQHCHASSLAAYWCRGCLRAGVARTAAAWLMLLLAAGGGSGGCCAGAHSPLSSASGRRHAGCCALLVLCASLGTVAVSLCGFPSMLLWC